MRITNQMSSMLVMGNLSATYDRLFSLQNQVSSGKRITRSSDDPVGTSQSLILRGAVAGIEQYSRNVERAKAQLALVDTSLGSISTALQESKRIALLGANSATSAEQRKNLALQVQQQIDNIVQAVNVTSMDRYIFSGFKTLNAPVTENPGGTPPYQYNGDDGEVRAQVSDSMSLGISLTARQVLNFDGLTDPAVPDILSVLTGLKQDLESGDAAAVSARVGQVEKSFQNTVALRGRMGARTSQVEFQETRLEDTKLTVSNLLSNVEDADIAEAVTKLQMEQNAYQAALIAAARSVQQSLADYLK